MQQHSHYFRSSTMISVHRLLGNMFLKGCVAVPLSRVFGAILQAREVWDDEVAFYTGSLTNHCKFFFDV